MHWCAPAAFQEELRFGHRGCVYNRRGEAKEDQLQPASVCFACLSNIWSGAAETPQDGWTSAGQLRWQVEHKEHPRGREEDQEQGRGGQRERRERGERERRGHHDCHVVSYSICCIAAQSGAEGGRTSITAQEVGEVISSVPLLAWEKRQNGTGPGSEETPPPSTHTERRSEEKPGRSVEVKGTSGASM